MKKNQFKPLHSWRDTIGEIPVYATTFFFQQYTWSFVSVYRWKI